jgi:hypothetical protein
MWGGDACVALGGGGRRSHDQDEGDASVPTPHIRHPRPYGKTWFLPPSLDASWVQGPQPLPGFGVSPNLSFSLAAAGGAVKGCKPLSNIQ